MNKRTLMVCISALSALVLIVAGAVVMLYSEKGGETSISEEEMFSIASSARPLMNAVPSDAAMILHCGSVKEGIGIMTDSTWIFRALFTGSGCSSFMKFVTEASGLLSGKARALRGAEMAVSMHYSGDIVPLLLVNASRFPHDTSSGEWELMRAADSSGISYGIFREAGEHQPALKKSTVIAFSPSETLVGSCSRNIEAGTSVLQNHECASAAAASGNSPAIFINNSYSGKLALSFLSRKGRGYAGFMKSYADWTVFMIESMSEKRISMSGTASSFDSPAYFSNMYRGIAPGTSYMKSILPAWTLSASEIMLDDAGAYIEAYRKYADAAGRIAKYNSALDAVSRKAGIAPAIWMESLKIKEICKAVIPVADRMEDVLLLRPGKEDPVQIFRGRDIRTMKDYDGSVMSSPLFASVGTLFGGLFSLQDSTYIYKDGWMICGPEDALKQFSLKERKTLDDYLSEIGAGGLIKEGGMVFQAYCSVSAQPESFAGFLSQGTALQARKMLDSITACPVVFSVEPGESSFLMHIEAARGQYSGSRDDAPAAAKDTVVNVPAGPFKVKNCATGKMNMFSQQTNNYLVLKDENGKGLWGVPFNAPICGAVAEIDYFGNGKIQFLFASGSKLYLIDRLGRFVKPFPVELGKEILIGPAAYDFTGAHGYTALVLHKDNTIGMYDLHGKVPSSWKGIKSEETIKSLPELLSVKGKKFWVVRTSARTVVYGFDGGTPVYAPDGNRRIRPDARLNVNADGSVTALCYDGKERSLKL